LYKFETSIIGRKKRKILRPRLS